MLVQVSKENGRGEDDKRKNEQMVSVRLQVSLPSAWGFND